MPRPSFSDQLPEEARVWLDEQLRKRAFSGYEELTEVVNRHFQSIGLELRITRSPLADYGKKRKEKIARIRSATLIAKEIRESTEDDADDLSGALIGLAKTELFEALYGLEQNIQGGDEEVDPTARVELIGKVSKGIAELTRASLAQKKHSTSARQAREAVAAMVEGEMRRQGVSEPSIEALRAAITQELRGGA
ncbi:conserved hypothetical protein [Gammaproteobacteria bacterium]